MGMQQGSSGQWQCCVWLWVLGHYLHLSVAVGPRLLQGNSGVSGHSKLFATFISQHITEVLT